MQKTVLHFLRYFMSLFDGKIWTYGNIQLGVKSVPQPSYPHFRNVPYPRSMVYSVSDFIDDFRVYPVKHTGKDGFAGLPYDSENCRSNEKTDDRVCQRIAQPDPDSTKEHGQTGEAVYPGVISPIAPAEIITVIIPIRSHCRAAKEITPITIPNQFTSPGAGKRTWIPNQTARLRTTPTTAAVMAERTAVSFLFPLNFSI